jgi:hypothetical protein
MANPDIGTITCPFECGSTAAVRKYKNEKNPKLYFSCQRCGIIRPNLPAGQDWILNHASMSSPASSAAPALEAPRLVEPLAPTSSSADGPRETLSPAPAPAAPPAPAVRVVRAKVPARAAPAPKKPPASPAPKPAAPRRSLLPDL